MRRYLTLLFFFFFFAALISSSLEYSKSFSSPLASVAQLQNAFSQGSKTIRLHQGPSLESHAASDKCFIAPNFARRIAVVGFMKNEAHILREWIEHYLWQGVDAVLLLDNDSTDGWRKVVTEFSQQVHVISAPLRHRQELQYNELACPWLYENSIDIVIVVDLDEFLFSQDERSLQEVLLEFFFDGGRNEQDTAALFVPWTCFGSSGLQTQPPTVREHFLWRHNNSNVRRGGVPDFINNGKTISRVSMIEKISIHRICTLAGASAIAGDRFIGERLPGPFLPGNDCKYGPPSHLGRAGPPLQLNHYPIQSWSYFESIKMKRGAADLAEYEKVRDKAYFEKYDFHEFKDTLLQDYVRRARANEGTRHDFKCRRLS